MENKVTIECGFTLKRVRDMKRTYSLHLMFEILLQFLKIINDGVVQRPSIILHC